MHLRNVEIFCDVIIRRSFSKAAAAHNVSQSSASQAVHLLEKRLDIQLIDRSKRPFQLTPAGKVYFDGCRQLLDSFHQVEERVQKMNNRVTGRVSVAAIYSVGLLEMDAYVRRFEQLYPEVDLRLDYLHPDNVYSQVVNDEADLGLVSFPRDGGEFGNIPWQEQRMALVVAATHQWADRGTIRPEEFAGENFIAFTKELSIRKKVDRWLKRAKVSVNIVHEFDNIENIKRAVEIGSGIAILPIPAVRKEMEARVLRVIDVDGVSWFRPLGIVHKRHKTLSTAVSMFVDLLHEDPDTFPEYSNEAFPSDIHHQSSLGKRPFKKQETPRVVS